MAEAAPSIPTFKLVLVGDGGTGKVRSTDLLHVLPQVLGCGHLYFHYLWRILILIKH
jgi:hypothetical protein